MSRAWRPGANFALDNHDHPHRHAMDPLVLTLALGQIMTDVLLACVLLYLIANQ